MTSQEASPIAEESRPGRVVINPVGIGLATLGALATIVSIFLPFADDSAFLAGVKENTLVQGDTGGAVLYVLLAVGVLGATSRYHFAQRAGWSVVVLGVIIVVVAIIHANNDELFTLTSVDPVTGDLDLSGQTVRADPAIALYVAGAGGALAALGGLLMRRSRELVAGAAATPEIATKQCPDCAERVQAAARVCRFCGYRFE